jgi:formamidopyrimidine-DNA glycosylase
MVKLISLKESTRKGKKLMAEFDDGTVTHFGASGYSDFTKHKDEERKQRYIARHSAQESFTNPKAASTLARYVLWNKPTLSASVSDYKKRFAL